MSVYCTLFSQTFYGLLFCYLTITDVHVTLYLQIIDFQFPSYCTSQPPKKLNQIITANSSTNTPRSYHQKNNSCTLCVPMFFLMSELHGPKCQEMRFPAFQLSKIFQGSMPLDPPRNDGLKPIIWVLWTHNRLLFTKLRLLKNLYTTLRMEV